MKRIDFENGSVTSNLLNATLPMLIAQLQTPFDDPKWICELKLDGCRCIAYLDENGSDTTKVTVW